MDNSFNDLKIYSYYSPVLIANSENETEAEFDERWKKFDLLSEEIKNKLSHEQVQGVIKAIQNRYLLDLHRIGCVSRVIRSYYFNDININDISTRLGQELQIDPAKAREISDLLIKNIIQAELKPASGARAALQKIPINLAIQKYPRIGEQLLSGNQIMIKNFPTPVRPSIKNWIADYHQMMGVEKHGSIERGNYLYHSENGKKLTAGERQKVAVILKSADENDPVPVDPEKQEVVFEPLVSGATQPQDTRSLAERGMADPNANQLYARTISPELKNIQAGKNEDTSARFMDTLKSGYEKIQSGGVRFSYPQKMPYERQAAKTAAQPPRPRPDVREAWSKQNGQVTSSQPVGSGQAPDEPPVVDAGTAKIAPEVARSWRNQTQRDYKPFRITPFGYDPSEMTLRESDDNMSGTGKVVDLKN